MSALGSLVNLQDAIHILPIAGVGVFALALALERGYALYVAYPIRHGARFFDEIRSLVQSGDITAAVELSGRYQSKPAGFVIHQALMRARQPEALIQHGLEIAVNQMSQKVQKRTSFLATLANVSTLLGLFGTILGLIHSFQALANVSAQQRSALLTQGISTAMNATLLGLGVAIPCMVIYSILASKTNRQISDIEESALQSVDILKEHFYADETPVVKKVG